MIQPNISLAVETPQLADPLETAGKVLSIRGMQQQQLLHGEQLKSAQIANQEHVKAQQDDTLNTQTWQQAQGDPDKHIELFAKSGARPQAVQSLQKHYADLRKEYAETGSKEAEIKKYTNQQLSGLTQKALDDPDMEQNWGQYVAAAHQIDPKTKLPDQPPPKDTLAHIRLAYTTDEILHKEADETRAQAEEKRKVEDADRKRTSQPLIDAHTKAETANLEAKTPGEKADSDIKVAGANALRNMTRDDWDKALTSIVPDIKSPLYTRTKGAVDLALARGDLRGAQTALKDAGDQLGRVETGVATAKATAPTKIEIGKALIDAQAGSLTDANGEPSAAVKMVADYQIPLSQLMARAPMSARGKLLEQIKSINPQFQESNYDVAKKTENDSVTGKIGTTSNSQNTALAHLGVLHDAASALKNGNIQILNRVANSIGAQVGSTAKTTYDAIVHKVGPELASAYIAGGGAVGERGATEHDFSSNNSPDQILSNIGISATLLKGKIDANQAQYDRGTYGRGKQKLLTEDAKKTLDKLSGGGSDGMAVTYQGHVYTFTDKGKMDLFKKDHGIK